jgi:hypothetical protein
VRAVTKLRLSVSGLLLAGLVAASVASAGPPQIVGGGGSVRADHTRLACLGVTDSENFGETFLEDGTLHLTIDGTGRYHVNINSFVEYAVYEAGANLPDPGDPNFLFAGEVDIKLTETFTPVFDEFGIFSTTYLIPFEMHNQDGTDVRQMNYRIDLTVFNELAEFISYTSVGGVCP